MAPEFGQLGLDFLQQIVDVHWDEGEQQALLAEYPPGPGAPDFESIGEVMTGTPTAYALDSGRSFVGVNMGASGLEYTVLTRGLVCFGEPWDGDPCFIACPEFSYLEGRGSDILKRGVLNEAGDALIWSTTATGASGKLMALSFAGDAFFAVYVSFAEDNPRTTIARFDGRIWTTSSAFPSSGSTIGAAQGGAVAAVIKDNPDPEQPPLIRYVAAGDIGQDNADFTNTVTNLMWAKSSNATTWSSASNEGMMAEPGTWYRLTFNFACTIAAGPVSETKQIFVVPAATKTRIDNPVHPDFPYAQLTAAAAVSENDGNSWVTIRLPGALAAGLDQASFGLAVTFIESSEGEGYFLLSDHEYITGAPGHTVPSSSLYQSSDGLKWRKIRTNNNWMGTLSAIAKDLDSTTIVHI